MAERMVEIDYSPSEGLTLRFRPISLSLVPEPTRQHLLAANRELLLALRSFVDQAIERVESSAGPSRGPRRVRVRDADQATEDQSPQRP